MDEYTPTTEDVRDAYAYFYFSDGDAKNAEGLREFDRWLAAHDAETARAAAEKAWNEGCRAAEQFYTDIIPVAPMNPYRASGVKGVK